MVHPSRRAGDVNPPRFQCGVVGFLHDPSGDSHPPLANGDVAMILRRVVRIGAAARERLGGCVLRRVRPRGESLRGAGADGRSFSLPTC